MKIFASAENCQKMYLGRNPVKLRVHSAFPKIQVRLVSLEFQVYLVSLDVLGHLENEKNDSITFSLK